MAPPSSPKRNRDLPNDILHKMILPRLPFKCLIRIKCISNELRSLISTDATFAADQARTANTSSSSFVYMKDGALSFFPDPELIGVPDPSLNFLNPRPFNDIQLVCSTNGLLLLEGEFNRKTSLCVCNPATKEMAFVPNPVDLEEFFDSADMGLAYDPRELPDQFTIVHPELHNHRDGWFYQFNVFRSNTGKWTHSSQSVCVGSNSTTSKAVCAKGVIYWPCEKYLLWYDTKSDLAGSVMLPAIDGMLNVGVYAGEITFCRTWGGGIEVWILTGGSLWDKLYATSWDSMVDAFNFSHGMKLCHKSWSEMFFKRHIIFPIGFDGQFVYIAMELKHRDDASRLFCWEIVSGRIEEKGLIGLSGEWDIDEEVFQYTNSMARVPQILNDTS